MPTRLFALSLICEEKPKQDRCKVYERNGQLVLAINNEYLLPENAPVRLTSAQLEELDYEKLYRAYSPRGRKSKVDPRVMFKVMVYGYPCGIYSSRKPEDACTYRRAANGCREMKKFRIMRHSPGFVQEDVPKLWRICFTSM